MHNSDTKEELISVIEKYLASKVASFDEDKHSETSFSRLGLDSLGHVELSAAIEKNFDIQVQPDIAFNYPTIKALTNHVLDLITTEAQQAKEKEHETA